MYDELVKSLRICEGACNKECVLYNSVQVDGDTCQNRLYAMAADAIEELSHDLDSVNEANIALYGALPKWISVEDDLPEVPDGEMFSKGVYVTDGTEINKACIMRDYDGATGWTYTGIGKITHWCEQIQLPEPPKDKS